MLLKAVRNWGGRRHDRKPCGSPFYASAQSFRPAKEHFPKKWVMIREIPASTLPATNPQNDPQQRIINAQRSQEQH
jgi:hypothetical protein